MTKLRDKLKTGRALRAAMDRLKVVGLPLSVSAVARDVGVDPSTVHKVYPEIAEAIRTLNSGSARARLDQTRIALATLKKTAADLRTENALLKADLNKLATINYMLTTRVELLEAQRKGAVLVMPVTTSGP